MAPQNNFTTLSKNFHDALKTSIFDLISLKSRKITKISVIVNIKTYRVNINYRLYSNMFSLVIILLCTYLHFLFKKALLSVKVKRDYNGYLPIVTIIFQFVDSIFSNELSVAVNVKQEVQRLSEHLSINFVIILHTRLSEFVT